VLTPEYFCIQNIVNASKQDQPMKRYPFLSLIFLMFGLAAQAEDLRHPSTLNSFCVDPEVDELCSTFPDDQPDFSDKFVYMFINVETQSRFDVFSWQAFAALNWAETGRESTGTTDEWTRFTRREEIFENDQVTAHCQDLAAGAEVLTSNVLQADGNVLIDQNGNFIVYETRVNKAAEDYIVAEMLNTYAGQIARGDVPVSFPQGRLPPDPTPASVLVKTSWRIMTPDIDPANYIVKDGLIHIAADHSATGEALCLRETLGLVGMHIVARVHSGNGDEWLWSTFEHSLTAPTAGNTRRVNAIFAKDLFPGGCSAPEIAPSQSYIFYDADCPDCPTNQPPASDWQWAATPPYARDGDARALQPSQIVRCWTVFEGTRELNDIWQQKLAGSALANYQLISTQWRGADKSPMFEHGEVPRFLTNTTMETFLQSADEGTCLGCHAEAETAAGNDANFTFLFQSVLNE